jgi:hypothetical protein
VRTIEVDAVERAERGIPLADASGSHQVRVILG